MKILKPGKVEMRKFVCPKCGCIFVASTADIRTEGGYDGVSCPEHGCSYFTAVTRGEPYDELRQDETKKKQDEYQKLQELIIKWDWWSKGTCGFARYLLDHGVTFRD